MNFQTIGTTPLLSHTVRESMIFSHCFLGCVIRYFVDAICVTFWGLSSILVWGFCENS